MTPSIFTVIHSYVVGSWITSTMSDSFLYCLDSLVPSLTRLHRIFTITKNLKSLTEKNASMVVKNSSYLLVLNRTRFSDFTYCSMDLWGFLRIAVHVLYNCLNSKSSTQGSKSVAGNKPFYYIWYSLNNYGIDDANLLQYYLANSL